MQDHGNSSPYIQQAGRTKAVFALVSLLNSEDFPTFGLPKIATCISAVQLNESDTSAAEAALGNYLSEF